MSGCLSRDFVPSQNHQCDKGVIGRFGTGECVSNWFTRPQKTGCVRISDKGRDEGRGRVVNDLRSHPKT